MLAAAEITQSEFIDACMGGTPAAVVAARAGHDVRAARVDKRGQGRQRGGVRREGAGQTRAQKPPHVERNTPA